MMIDVLGHAKPAALLCFSTPTLVITCFTAATIARDVAASAESSK